MSYNHFCIYCGAKLIENQHFCSQCGKKVYEKEEEIEIHIPSKYDLQIKQIEEEYNVKQKRASELVSKLFDPSHMAYQKFTSAINKSNQLFDSQLGITKKMIEIDDGQKDFVQREIEGKIQTLNTFIDKMEELINELVINLSSNKKDDDDINNLFNDMDDLIGSVKDYS